MYARAPTAPASAFSRLPLPPRPPPAPRCLVAKPLTHRGRPMLCCALRPAALLCSACRARSQANLREISLLRRLRHPNIVQARVV